ncbi:hypothetical protein GGX14DRAFT_472746 [Mycena pura]|uniref:Uncharacterized protein n=1 Tax=Mycena pura TaxID=153505 RepID=A0AAD6UZL4_9AGAR|nr:hypothetical protein GGX14DRAFT_472746 [Mycena pura]
MPFVDSPSLPAQTHPVRLKPPSLRGLPFGTYLALALVILSVIGVLCYAAYSFHHAINLNPVPLPQYAAKSHEKRTKAKVSRPAKFNFKQLRPAPSGATNDDTNCLVDRGMGLPQPHVAFPSAAFSPPAKARTLPQYDMHNIRFASLSNVAIYTNPKLSPVVGSAVPLSYDSQDNFFPNLFTPTTTANRKVKANERSASILSLALRGKRRSKTSRAGKENCRMLEEL